MNKDKLEMSLQSLSEIENGLDEVQNHLREIGNILFENDGDKRSIQDQLIEASRKLVQTRVKLGHYFPRG